METKYFKKESSMGITRYMSVEKNESGIDVMVEDSGSMASVNKRPCQVMIEGYEPCTEEEFNIAFELAIAVLTSGFPVAA